MDETETPTPTPTETPTPTATFTPTPSFYIEVTLEPGIHARIARETSVADYGVILVLVAILISMWVMFLAYRLGGRGGR